MKNVWAIALLILSLPTNFFAQSSTAQTNFADFEKTVLGKTQEKALEIFIPLAAKPETKAKTPLVVTEAETKNLVGVYSQPNRWQSEVFIKDGKLFLKQFNRELPLTKIGENRFSFQFPAPDVTQELIFKIGAGGKASLLHQFVWAFKCVEATI